MMVLSQSHRLCLHLLTRGVSRLVGANDSLVGANDGLVRANDGLVGANSNLNNSAISFAYYI
ncbi:hypothetical protein [Alloprevotella tannerae]|uniref:hypothetical protein n=1 Tax=Alloprevotella tannerae TaxID=76122 RepID=UPI001EDC0160|nr:hypothetical protein [Alloprevotella tannerae]MCG2652214.1 hypothetical protein [Alloprevotella tannerae]